MRMLYKYPQVEYPYDRLARGEPSAEPRRDREFELIDALGDAFAAGRYFDVFVEYAKADQEDILCRITAYNRGPEPAPLHILPHDLVSQHLVVGLSTPNVRRSRPTAVTVVRSHHRHLGERWWYLDDRAARPDASVHRERDQPRAALRRAQRRARTSRTRFTRRSSAAGRIG